MDKGIRNSSCGGCSGLCMHSGKTSAGKERRDSEGNISWSPGNHDPTLIISCFSGTAHWW